MHPTPAGADLRRPDRRSRLPWPEDARLAAFEAFSGWIADRQAEPMFLVNRNMTLVFLNRAARRFVAQAGSWIRTDSERLEIDDPTLEQALRNVMSARVARGTRKLTSSTRSINIAWLRQTPADPDLYVLSLARPAKQPDPDKLMRALRLTRAEAQIALAIYQGADRPSIAEKRGVYLSTVKTQLQSIFRKLGVHDQRELVRKIGEWEARRDEDE
jgi:DNA-binding CsgD family transcriptional regulator